MALTDQINAAVNVFLALNAPRSVKIAPDSEQKANSLKVVWDFRKCQPGVPYVGEYVFFFKKNGSGKKESYFVHKLINICTKQISYSYCIPGAKRGYYGFIIARVRRDFLLATYSPHFFPDYFHIWQVA